jgi:hypothetical protein
LEEEVRLTKRIAELRRRVRDQGLWVLTLTEERDYWQAEAERLRTALDRAGDRLAQVQPGVTEPWAFDIVPKAEQEIADALTGSTAQLDAQDHAGRR